MDPEFSGTAGKGETVNVRRLGVQTAADFSGTTVPVTEAEVTVPIVLSNQPYVQSLVTAKEKTVQETSDSVTFRGAIGTATIRVGREHGHTTVKASTDRVVGLDVTDITKRFLYTLSGA